jgi:hypothetical protein
VTQGERETDGYPPVVGDELHRVDPNLGEEALDEARQPRERVVEVATLAGTPEPDQVGRDSAGPGEELDPVVRARRNPVEVQHRHAGSACAPVEHG